MPKSTLFHTYMFFVVLLLLFSPRAQAQSPIALQAEKPGASIPFRKYISKQKGHTTLFLLYSEYGCPCQTIKYYLNKLAREHRDHRVYYLDINRESIKGRADLESPLAEQFRLTRVPSVFIYNSEGQLIYHGLKAKQYIQQKLFEPHSSSSTKRFTNS